MTSGVSKGPGNFFDQMLSRLVAAPRASDMPDAGADDSAGKPPPDQLFEQAQQASAFLKALAHEGRLMILCSLATGEKSVTELENLLNSRQAAVSQQLARLRLEGIVSARRDGKAIYYTLRDPKAAQMIALLFSMFCQPDPDGGAAGGTAE